MVHLHAARFHCQTPENLERHTENLVEDRFGAELAQHLSMSPSSFEVVQTFRGIPIRGVLF